MAKSFKSNSRDVIFDPTCMTVEEVVDVDTDQVTGHVVIHHYLDENEHPNQIHYNISKKAYDALTK